MRNEIIFIDLFAGIGGFRLGLESINGSENRRSKEVAKTTSEERPGLVSKTREEIDGSQRQLNRRFDDRIDQRTFTCVWSNEWDKYCAEIYEKNFGEKPDTRDIKIIPTEEIPDHDLLCAGFPCQSFSIAGKGGGFDDTRGTLFFEICRIAKAKRPKILLLENVKGLLSHEKGRTFAIILLSLDELGYDAEWQVLNSKDFGVPQNRERVFIVGHLRERSTPEIFPLQEGYAVSHQKDERTSSRNQDSGSREPKSALMHSRGLETRKNGLSHTIKGGGGGSSKNFLAYGLTKDYSKVPLNRGETYLKYIGAIMTEKNRRRLRDGKDLSRNFPQGQRVYSVEGIASTLSSQAGGLGAKTGLYFDSLHGFGHGWQGYHNRKALKKGLIRRLTPTECERLQGFPDGWTEGVSDTQRYRMLGNAVTVNVIETLGRHIKEALNEEA
ncbi:MAG: DNA (cytosine-5-)-methyltransferase [Desulfobacterales bacterium]|nr:DNA (cytosine-5-)-methyltransferase [Desulfobacterales bacterium]